MKYILFLFILIGCSENNHTYFPLGKIKSWSYKIEIEPEVDKKTVYKKINLSLGKKKLELEGKKESFYPFLREDGSIFFYKHKKNGIFRSGFAFAKDQNINKEKRERMVLPSPIKIGKKWSVDSKTYLILKRYPYYDYRATTNFMIDYEIISTDEIISTPTGKFRNCILIRGIGNTKFIGDSEIGSIDINILSEEWYAKGIGLIKSVRIEETDSDLFGTTKMTQVLEGFKEN